MANEDEYHVHELTAELTESTLQALLNQEATAGYEWIGMVDIDPSQHKPFGVFRLKPRAARLAGKLSGRRPPVTQP